MHTRVIPDAALRPFVLGSSHTARTLATNEVDFFEVLAPESLPVFQLINAGNSHAFGGLAVPAWVQLDCYSLPTAMIGWAVPQSLVPTDLWQVLLTGVETNFGVSLDHYDGLVPLSSYTALPSLEPGTVIGISLYSLVRGLGLRTKAAALARLGARRQIGLTQYGNRAVRTHTALGPLEVLAAQAPPHSLPDETFVYRIELDGTYLAALARGEPPRPPTQPVVHRVPIEPGRTSERIAVLAHRDRITILGVENQQLLIGELC